MRVDVGRLGKAERIAGGGVRVEGAVANVGVLTYRRADGTETRELFPPEEARRPESLKTLQDAPVTIGHPGGGTRMVSPETFRQDSVGHVSGSRSDGRSVLADIAIQDAEAIRKVDAGELAELSPGYILMIDPTPGVFDGQRYDVVQRNRDYNHLALLPPGGARGGASASLRIDGVDDYAVQVRTDQITAPAPAPRSEMRSDGMATEHIDGIPYEIGTEGHRTARTRHDAKAAGELKELAEAKASAEAKLATEKGRADKAEARADAAEKRVKELEDPARLDARASERAALLEASRRVLGAEWKADGLSDRQIREAVLAKIDGKDFAPETLKARSDDYVTARFDAEIKHAPGATSAPTGSMSRPLGEALSGVTPDPTQSRVDSATAKAAMHPNLSHKSLGSLRG